MQWQRPLREGRLQAGCRRPEASGGQDAEALQLQHPRIEGSGFLYLRGHFRRYLHRLLVGARRGRDRYSGWSRCRVTVSCVDSFRFSGDLRAHLAHRELDAPRPVISHSHLNEWAALKAVTQTHNAKARRHTPSTATHTHAEPRSSLTLSRRARSPAGPRRGASVPRR